MRKIRLSTGVRVAASLALAACLSACTNTPDEAEGRGSVRAIHAIADLSTVSFLIEETPLESFEYLNTSALREFDALQYDFNFDFASGATGDSARLISTSATVAIDTAYTFVLHGTANSPQVTTLSHVEREFDAAGTVLELWFANFSRVAPNVDFYLGEEGFDPAVGMPFASNVAPTTATVPAEVESQLVEFVVTPAGDASTELFRSEPTTLSAAETLLVTLIDAGGEVNGDYALSVGGVITSGLLIDSRELPEAQFVNASFSSGPIDIFLTDDLTTPLVAGLAPGVAADPVAIAEADDTALFNLTITPAGNPGVILDTSDLAISEARTSLVFFTGRQADDNLGLVASPSTRRPVFDAARFSVFNGVQDVEFIDLYLLEEDQTLDDTLPRARGINSSQSIDQVTLSPQSLNMVLRDTETDTTRFGPVELVLAAGDVVRLLLVDTANPATSEIVVLRL